MQWSHYSEALFDHYTSAPHNIIVQACPGAGKTTNIKHLWTLDDKSTVYLVFNKHNQIEAEQKLPMKTASSVLTLNGLGHRAILANIGRVILDDRKVHSIVRQCKTPVWKVLGLPYRAVQEREWACIKAVQQCKSTFADNFTAQQFGDMVSTYDLDSYEGLYDDVVMVLQISDSTLYTIDFADQIRFPVIHDMVMPHYHNVLGDEVQDFSPLQAMLVGKLQGERYVFVGDRHQSIYGFRGAMNDSMDVLANRFNCTELPLSITYRCAKNIVAEASAIYADIEPWDMSSDGLVLHGAEHAVYFGDCIVLCRMNRPLIALAYELLEKGIACHVRGRDIGQGLITLIKKQEARDVRQLITHLSAWYDLEKQKAVVQEDESKLQRLTDRYESCLLFIRKCALDDSPDVVIDQINTLFEQGRGVCLSTVHKAKGLEAERAYLLEAGLYDVCTSRAQQPWQAVQERNVKYVAITRGKGQLVYM